MLSALPLEIQVRLIMITPSSSLKYVNSHFYMLYNDLFYNKIIETFGEGILRVIIKILPWLKRYIKSLDAFRFEARNAIASRLKLIDKPDTGDTDDPAFLLNSLYVKDSWRYVYSVLKNRRLFAEYSDYKIDEPTNYVYNHFVEINRTYLLSYAEDMWLSAGKYNLNIGLVIKHGSGLGTTKFEVKYKKPNGGDVTQTFYPPTNINEILPKQQFCLLKIGEFEIPQYFEGETKEDLYHHEKLFKVRLVMEEIGLYLKSGFRIFFIDVAQHSMLFNDYDLLYYAINETDYKYFINLPLKNLYKVLSVVENGNLKGSDKKKLPYGQGDPDLTDLSLDENYKIPNNAQRIHTTDVDTDNDSELMNYSNFYFNNRFKMRLFKFNTIYQQRQFINRFGNFELDWRDYADVQGKNVKKEHNVGPASQRKSCNYDIEGIKWKIPILGEL